MIFSNVKIRTTVCDNGLVTLVYNSLSLILEKKLECQKQVNCKGVASYSLLQGSDVLAVMYTFFLLTIQLNERNITKCCNEHVNKPTVKVPVVEKKRYSLDKKQLDNYSFTYKYKERSKQRSFSVILKSVICLFVKLFSTGLSSIKLRIIRVKIHSFSRKGCLSLKSKSVIVLSCCDLNLLF